MDIFQWRNFGVSSSTEEFSITPLVTTSHQSQTYIPSISVLPKNERQHKWTFILNYYWTLLVSGKCLDEDTDHDDDGRNDHEAKKTSLDIFCTHIILRSSSTVATGCSGRSGTLWVERSSTGTLADAWTFSKKKSFHLSDISFGMNKGIAMLGMPKKVLLGSFSLSSCIFIESARAFTGRRCPHSGKGEDFLSRQPDFFT